MPRDANGNYTNANAPVNAGETILASTYNTENDDKANELTDSLSRSGKGPMLAQFKASDGTVSAPGISFGTDLSNGFYRASANDPRAAVNGGEALRFKGYSADVPEMQQQIDPGSPGSEVLATTYGQEHQQMRYAVARALGGAYWYSDPITYSVADPRFGAALDGTTDDTSALNAALSAAGSRGGGYVEIPATPGGCMITGTVTVPNGVELRGSGRIQAAIKCRQDLAPFTSFIVGAQSVLGNLYIVSETTRAGIGVQIQNASGFAAGIFLEKVQVTNFDIGVDVARAFDITLRDCYVRLNRIGVNVTPQDLGGDSGYVNQLYILESYFFSQTEYDIYCNPFLRVVGLHVANTIFNPGATIAQVFLNNCNPAKFTNCYWENQGATPPPAISSSLSNYILDSCYMIYTGGIVAANNEQKIILRNLRTGSATDILNAPNDLNTVILERCGFPASGNSLPPVQRRHIVNSSLDGIEYAFVQPEIQLRDSDRLGSIKAFTRTLTGITIPAGATQVLMNNVSASNIWNANTVGFASITNEYHPGLILTVTPPTTANPNFFSVIAYNATTSGITLTSAEISIQFMRTFSSTAV